MILTFVVLMVIELYLTQASHNPKHDWPWISEMVKVHTCFSIAECTTLLTFEKDLTRVREA